MTRAIVLALIVAVPLALVLTWCGLMTGRDSAWRDAAEPEFV